MYFQNEARRKICLISNTNDHVWDPNVYTCMNNLMKIPSTPCVKYMYLVCVCAINRLLKLTDKDKNKSLSYNVHMNSDDSFDSRWSKVEQVEGKMCKRVEVLVRWSECLNE